MSYRTNESQEKYVAWCAEHPEAFSTCFLCAREGDRFTYWKVVPNEFPYDRVAERNDMLVPIRHVELESELTREERVEFSKLKESAEFGERYDKYVENPISNRTAPTHFHVHLLRSKGEFR